MLFAVLGNLSDKPASAGEILTQHLPFQLIGLLVVLTTLSTLYAICALVGSQFRRVAANQERTKATAAAAAAALVAAELPPPGEHETSARIAAVIAAAVAVSLERPHRLLDIHQTGHPVGMSSAWAIEGRFQHFSSHKVR